MQNFLSVSCFLTEKNPKHYEIYPVLMPECSDSHSCKSGQQVLRYSLVEIKILILKHCAKYVIMLLP